MPVNHLLNQPKIKNLVIEDEKSVRANILELLEVETKIMKNILVIEDDKTIQANILELLQESDYNVIAANNGLIGIRLAQDNIPDLILCDVMMPDLDGYGVLKALRQDPLMAAIPFIFITALADRSNTRKGMELGADDYLIKPFTPDELLKAIATRLEKQTALTGVYTSALKQASQQLNKLAHYDNLTDLPNRLLLQERFNYIINDSNLAQNCSDSTSKKAGNEEFIFILCLGIDRFTRIIEILGHSGGDLLIKAVAERLQSCLNTQDTLARLSTDEFVIIFTKINHKKDVIDATNYILGAISKPFLLEDGNEVFLTASIGIALYPRDGKDIQKLLQSASKAMNYAKQQGGNIYEFYRANFNVGSSDSLALETSLSYALERKELLVYYQPKVNLQTGKITGAEALIRWLHPDKGLISPAKFIPIAEETNLIIPIGEWVLKTACQQIKTWQKAGFSALQIAVNLSGRQFNLPNLRSMLFQILIETGLEPQYLELELTESILVQEPEVGSIRLKALKALGINIAIDDFGTGYSSLSYLQQFPFDILKIDQCFVRNLTTDPKTKAITTAIIQMAHNLNLKLVAEGVETNEELAFLQENNCDEIQGYLFSRPLTAQEFGNLLRSGQNLQFTP